MNKISKNCLVGMAIALSFVTIPEIIFTKPILAESFIDISGVNGETEINQLTQLGVIETTSDEFQPSATMTRGKFVAWLVKTYNKLHRNPILIPTTSSSSFPDVASDHPHFSYIQAAHEAGFLAGFADGTFRPDEVLTREQMITLKTMLDTSSGAKDNRPAAQLKNAMNRTRGYRDADEISDEFIAYLIFDDGNAAGGRNFQRVYGRTTLYQPQKPVTRAEAAILLSKFRRGENIERVLQREGS